jgi:aspartyl-tRNA(Asn)/glutamyl-tRNA(Gln) amidotransferase subunit A
MKPLPFATIKELQTAYTAGTLDPRDVLTATLDRFKRFDPELGSALEIFDQESIVKKSSAQGSLFGIPGLLKDNICQKDRITSCGSKILANYRAPYDATATMRLKAAGAWIVGRANCDEFAMGSSTETSAFQKTKNPWDFGKVPGGSSGGSIAAVAAGLVPWALGTETGGSVRQPAALCGIVGLKPTYGLISRSGVVAYASSIDQIGIATRTAYDNALVLRVIAGQDDADASTVAQAPRDYTRTLDGNLPKPLKIGILTNALHAEGVSFEVQRAIQDALNIFKKLGATVEELAVPSMDYGAAVYFIVSRAESASNLARFDGVRYGSREKKAPTLAQMYTQTRSEGFGTEVKARIMIGNYVLSVGHADEFYVNARKVQQLMRYEFEQAFKEVDILICPTAPGPAFSFGAFEHDKLQLDLQDYFTCSANLVGIPAISIPCGFSSEQLPLGLQLIGPRLSEELLLKVAHAYEQQTSWHTMHPPSFM